MKSTNQPADSTPEQRSADQDAAIEAAFVDGALPEEDRRAPEPERMTGEQFAAMQALDPSLDTSTAPPRTRRVTVVAQQRGFDGVVVIEAGEQFIVDLKDGEDIPAWSTLVTE